MKMVTLWSYYLGRILLFPFAFLIMLVALYDALLTNCATPGCSPLGHRCTGRETQR